MSGRIMKQTQSPKPFRDSAVVKIPVSIAIVAFFGWLFWMQIRPSHTPAPQVPPGRVSSTVADRAPTPGSFRHREAATADYRSRSYPMSDYRPHYPGASPVSDPIPVTPDSDYAPEPAIAPSFGVWRPAEETGGTAPAGGEPLTAGARPSVRPTERRTLRDDVMPTASNPVQPLPRAASVTVPLPESARPETHMLPAPVTQVHSLSEAESVMGPSALGGEVGVTYVYPLPDEGAASEDSDFPLHPNRP